MCIYTFKGCLENMKGESGRLIIYIQQNSKLTIKKKKKNLCITWFNFFINFTFFIPYEFLHPSSISHIFDVIFSCHLSMQIIFFSLFFFHYQILYLSFFYYLSLSIIVTKDRLNLVQISFRLGTKKDCVSRLFKFGTKSFRFGIRSFFRVVWPINHILFLLFHVVDLCTFFFCKIILYGVSIFAFCFIFEKLPK